MTKTSSEVQDLRRRIYIKAKPEKHWRFWGLYAHVCKLETLKRAYELAKAHTVLGKVVERYLPNGLSGRKKIPFSVDAIGRMEIASVFFDSSLIADLYCFSKREFRYLFLFLTLKCSR